MADYIYLLENRLSPAQQRALSLVRNAVRARDLTLFLTGGAVRDLTGGGSVRDLDLTVQGETTRLRPDLEAAGGVFVGEFSPAQALYFVFPGGVRVEVSAAMSMTFPKPGKPKYELTSIGEDLRRRDFTANSMALSLNEGSYGLLMDPLNGVADIENRELRLVSNYGFIEDPARLLRAVRLRSRLGWQMEARTQQRYDNAREDAGLDVLSKFARGYEVEEIFHEEDPLRIMRALDAEGWLNKLAPQLALGKSNDAALADVRDKQGQLQTQGIVADSAALIFPLLTAKLPAADVAALKSSFAREGFVREIETLEERTRELQGRFNGKEAGTPSAAWRLLYDAEPGLVLSMFYGAKSGSVQNRLKTFLTESPTARQRLPYAVLQELRIMPDMPVYTELLDKVFFELMDGNLSTPEEMKAYLEPFSPPAPPPPLNLRRARAKKEARPSRAKAKKLAASVAAEEEAIGVAEGLMEPGTLTGTDRGDAPTPVVPLEGKVAPLAPGEAEPEAAVSAPVGPKKSSARTKATAAVVTETGSAAAKKLTATPAPAAESEDLIPHPLANKDIAQAKSAPAVLPQAEPPVPAKTSSGVRPSKSPATAVPKKPDVPATDAGSAKKAVATASGKATVKAREVATGKAGVKGSPSKAGTKPVAPAKSAPKKGSPAKAPVKAAAAKTATKTVGKKPSANSPAVAKKASAKSGAVKAQASAPRKVAATGNKQVAVPAKKAVKQSAADAKKATKRR